jgi:hypothetical protein
MLIEPYKVNAPKGATNTSSVIKSGRLKVRKEQAHGDGVK